MENKINIAELLKDCPKDMELDCTMFDNVQFVDIKGGDKPICIRTEDIYRYLTKFGTWTFDEHAKCVIFPKGKTTWDGFQKPFKDGDIVVSQSGSIFILKEPNKNNYYYGCYIAFDFTSKFIENCTQLCSKKGCRFATESEKQKLFDVIKANGYRWNSETNTLEKLPKFKVGNKIKKKNSNNVRILEITAITPKTYIFRDGSFQYVEIIDKDYELISSKSDIITFKPFDKVLVRDNEDCIWKIEFYDSYIDRELYPYICLADNYNQCIPYNKETANLVGTTNDCPDKYKSWKDER